MLRHNSLIKEVTEGNVKKKQKGKPQLKFMTEGQESERKASR